MRKANPYMFLERFKLPVTRRVEERLEKEAPEELAESEELEWSLLLVNAWCPLPEDYSFEMQALPNGMKVDARIYEDVMAMLEDCQEAGLSPMVCSAYRSRATQKRLYNNKVARLRSAGYGLETAKMEAARWVALPGTSEHHTGLALDIVSSSYTALTRRQEKTAEQQWLMEHCWEYGFILRYPEEKGDITGIYYEPWHYRYVGREAALEIRDSGLCFEEYLAAELMGITEDTPAL